jgi:hypothetical protein
LPQVFVDREIHGPVRESLRTLGLVGPGCGGAALLTGLAFGREGSVVAVAFVAVGLFLAAVSVGMMLKHRSEGRSRVEALEHGQAVLGEILGVAYDEKAGPLQTPWCVTYAFDTPTGRRQGQARTADESARQRRPGQQVHVLYLPADPHRSTIYPPLS